MQLDSVRFDDHDSFSCADKLDNLMAIRRELEWAEEETAFWGGQCLKIGSARVLHPIGQSFRHPEKKSAALKFLTPQFLSAVDSLFRN